jgi:carbamoyltransferase
VFRIRRAGKPLLSLNVLGINAVFHDPAAALVVDGEIVAAAEEERFTRRKHGKPAVPFSTWELPERSARWCLDEAGLDAGDLDAIGYSYDPALAPRRNGDVTADGWESLRTLYAERAPRFLATALPGLDPDRVRFVPHHVAHAASAAHASPFSSAAVLVLDGRGERTSSLTGRYDGERLEVLHAQPLPDSLGLFYEEATEHLGFHRSSDEYKVMALAAYGRPAALGALRKLVRPTGHGGFRSAAVPWDDLAPAARHEEWQQVHADLAASVQRRLEEVLLALATDVHEQTGETRLVLAGGVALNCVANSVLYERGPFEEIWVQPAAGDAGTALGAALAVSSGNGARTRPMQSAALGRSFTDEQVRAVLEGAGIAYEETEDVSAPVAEALADDAIVGWFQGRSEFGPRALGHRSLLAHPGKAENLDRLNAVKGRESFRPVAPMVLAERAAEIFEGGPLPSPFMLFTHRVRPAWRERIPAAVHVDGTARVQTVDADEEPLVAHLLEVFERRTGLPVVINTSLNTRGRPMVDDPLDALECFGSAPIDLLAIGSFLVRRHR